MENPGEMLREAREAKDITLKEASHATKIGIKFLKALENNEYDIFPTSVYVRYFMKNYANFLGLDPEKLAGPFKFGEDVAKKVQPQERRLSDVTKRVIAISVTMILWWLLWVIYQAVVVKF